VFAIVKLHCMSGLCAKPSLLAHEIMMVVHRVVNRYEMPVIGYGSRSCDAEPVIRHQPA
jgi:hypothetical protein